MTKKRFSTGIQTFADIRNDDYYYVDKTPYILELVEEKYIFYPDLDSLVKALPLIIYFREIKRCLQLYMPNTIGIGIEPILLWSPPTTSGFALQGWIISLFNAGIKCVHIDVDDFSHKWVL